MPKNKQQGTLKNESKSDGKKADKSQAKTSSAPRAGLSETQAKR